MTKHGSRERAPKRLGRLDATVRVSGPKSDEVTTGPKSEDLHPAVRRLLSELDQLLSELERASSALPASPKQERERYICILVALSKFVHKVGGTLEQVRHIVELAKLLEDLDRGIVGPALERTHFGQGRTGDSSLVWEARGRVALGLEALTRLGEYRKDVARSGYATALARAIIIAPANTAAASFLSPPAYMRGSAAPLTVRRITGHVQYAF
jgi:hypothetical protein